MLSQQQMQPEEWSRLHNALRDNLESEIRLTRELLSNMHQEEVSLILQDPGTWNQVIQLRFQMLEKLGSLRTRRIETTQKIEKLVSTSSSKAPTLEEILPPGEEITAEILSMSDQLMALTERMNRQQSQNQRLQTHGYSPPLQLVPQTRPKRKASVTTYNIKK